MNEPVDWQERRDLDRAKAALLSRFPGLVCLRCGKDSFALRRQRDASLVPEIVKSDGGLVIELICLNCGFQEKHVVGLLSDDATAQA